MKKVFLLIFLLLFITSCAHTYGRIELDRLKLGMTKQEVRNELGRPFNVIGSMAFPEGLLEVWEYRRYHLWYDYLEEQYWLYFFDDRLEQWGRPGDWEREVDRIYEFRFR